MENLKENLKLNDRLFYILFLTKSRLRRDLRAYSCDLQEAFYGIDRKTRGRTGFVFSDSGPIPYSSNLDEAIGILSNSGMVIRPDLQNPSRLSFTLAGESYFHDLKERWVNKKEAHELNHLAKLLAEKLEIN